VDKKTFLSDFLDFIFFSGSETSEVYLLSGFFLVFLRLIATLFIVESPSDKYFSLRRLFVLVHYKKQKTSMSFFLGKRFISSFPSNGTKKMLFLSLCFKAIKNTVKASVNGLRKRFGKKETKKDHRRFSFSTVSVLLPIVIGC
jgi:hypothetical protein